MSTLRPAALTLLLLAAPLLHATLSVHPHAPTTADAITFRTEQTCSVGSHTVTRTGNEIQVLLGGGRCPSPPWPYAYEVPLGKLPAGRYRVTVPEAFGANTFTFVVRDADPAVAIRPSVVLAGPQAQPASLTIEARQDFSLCGDTTTSTCASSTIEIGGVAVANAFIGSGLGHFDAPALTPGWKDVRITNPAGTFVFPSAVYYHAPGSQPDPYAFEHVLFPILHDTDGVNGSMWRSEAVALNPTRWTIPTATSASFAPRERKTVTSTGFPRGFSYLLPRGEADRIAFSLRVRDVSRVAQGLGTQVPVVRERDMFRQPAVGPLTVPPGSGAVDRNSDITLLDVPLDPRYRVRVRAYAFDVDTIETYGRDPLIRIAAPDGTIVSEVRFTLTPACAEMGCPLNAEVDLAAGAEGQRADLFVQLPEGLLGWAFASVTNNETQQVTIVSPNGNGGRACVATGDC